VTFVEGSFSLSESTPINVVISNETDTVTYDHPLQLSIGAGGTAVSCADSATIKVQSGDQCCNPMLTGYSVFVGRASSPMGPFVDRQGVSMAAVNAGGYDVCAQNGSIGPGRNVLFTDESGQDYILYHALPPDAPAYPGARDYTSCPALISPLDWSSDGWADGSFAKSIGKQIQVEIGLRGLCS
jgi:Glycosyl hydrolases family 43